MCAMVLWLAVPTPALSQTPALAGDRLFAAVDGHIALMMLIDPDSGLIVDANRSALQFYGYPRLVGMYIQDINILSPEEVAAERQRAVLESRNYFLFPHRLADGSVSMVEVYSSPVIQPATGRTLLLSILHPSRDKLVAEEDIKEYVDRLNLLVAQKARELTTSGMMLAGTIVLMVTFAALGLLLVMALRNRRRSEQHARDALSLRLQLYRELQHRVKNSLALISSIISIERQRSAAGEDGARLEALRDRVSTLAALYDHIFLEESDGALECSGYIRAIVDGLRGSLGSASRAMTFELELAELELSSRQASALGLIVNELVTNALKHGPWDNTILVKLQKYGKNVRLLVQSSGELPAGFSLEGQKGFGLMLSAELARQLGGSLCFRSTGGSVEFSVDFLLESGPHQV